MRYTGIQPQYFPRLHYFARILATDIFMIRDDVQFVIKHKYPDGQVDKSYQAHTPIKHSFGKHLLAIPTKHGNKPLLAQTKISYGQDWAHDHLKALQFAYSNAPNFKALFPQIEKLLRANHANLAALNTKTILWGILNLLSEQNGDKISIESLNKKLKNQKVFRLKKIKLASQSKALKKNKNLDANGKIVALCLEVGATEDYCGGTGVAAYINHDLFGENGIKITVQDWKCDEYRQLFPKHGFIPNLSVIDLLMNVPRDKAAKIIAR